MSMHRNLDGSYLLTDDADPARTLVVQPGGDLDAAVVSFFGPYVPQEPSAWDRFTPREYAVALLTGMVQQGLMTQAKAQAALTSAIAAIKR